MRTHVLLGTVVILATVVLATSVGAEEPSHGIIETLEGKAGLSAGWLTLAFINAILAQIKCKLQIQAGQDMGMGGLFWFIMTLLFGPLATVALVFKEPTHL